MMLHTAENTFTSEAFRVCLNTSNINVGYIRVDDNVLHWIPQALSKLTTASFNCKTKEVLNDNRRQYTQCSETSKKANLNTLFAEIL